ncbi:hypothetical protein HDU83_000423 [Entophlyctis luteolus]|nr:hypothetical protein HDU83_000423 [Entophlyctis luteolus]
MGPNQINKVRKNLTVAARAQRSQFKRLIGANTENTVKHVNSLVDLHNSRGSKTVLRAARVGKGKAYIRPTEIGRKKLRKIAHAHKMERAHLIAAGSTAVASDDAMHDDGESDASDANEDFDIAPKSKRRSAATRVRIAGANEEVRAIQSDMASDAIRTVPVGKGTTLGRPGVRF